MPLQITGRHISVTPDQRDYIEKKVPRLRRLCDQIDELAFTVGHEKLQHLVEINFRSGTVSTFTKCAHEEPLAAIDLAIDKAVSQIKKALDKRSGNKKHAGNPRRELDLAEEMAEEIEETT